jgi:hypothetical protein
MDSKRKWQWIAVAVGASLLLLGGCHRRSRSEAAVKTAETKVGVVEAAKHAEKSADEIDFPVKQEVRQSYKLAPNAMVSIAGINGLLEVETVDTDTAEIYIVRSARQQDDFNDRD